MIKVVEVIKVNGKTKINIDSKKSVKANSRWCCWYLLFTFITLTTFTTSTTCLHASFEETGVGARASALNGAFTPVADDAYALYYNPAGLRQLSRKEFSASYGLIHTGLRDQTKINNSFIAYAHPFNQLVGTFGVSWQQVYTESLYKEQVITLGYGRRLSKKVSIGFNTKHLYREFSAPNGTTDDLGFTNTGKTDAVFKDGNSGSNIAFDAGLLWQIGKRYSFGIMAQDINEPDMAISKENRSIVPMVLRTGLAYQERSLTLIGQVNTSKSVPPWRDQTRNTFFTAAAEKWWLSTKFTNADLAVRGSFFAGSENFSQMGMGLSYRLGGVQLDYGFLMPLKGLTFGTTQGSHRFSLAFRFGDAVPDTDFRSRIRSVESTIRKAEQQIEYYKEEAKKTAQELEQLKVRAEQRQSKIAHVRVTEGEEAARKFITDQYDEEFNRYWIRKMAGSTLDERVKILTRIVEEFGRHKLELKIAKKELEIAKSERAKAEVKLAAEWTTYLRLAARGASIIDRIEMIGEMTDKFAPTGLDLSQVYDELQYIKVQK